MNKEIIIWELYNNNNDITINIIVVISENMEKTKRGQYWEQ